MTPDQRLVADVAMAALTEDHEELADLVNNLTDDKTRPVAAHTLTFLVSIFRNIIDPADWQGLIDEAKASRLLLDLDPS